jgi:hypothetical protein
MRTRTIKPTIIDVDIDVIHQVLERARAALSADDLACIEGLVQTLIDMTKP